MYSPGDRDGAIRQAGPPREVFERPASAFIARFIGGHNVIPSSRGKLAVRADKTRLSRQPMPASDAATKACGEGKVCRGNST